MYLYVSAGICTHWDKDIYIHILTGIKPPTAGASCGQKFGNVLRRKWRGRRTQKVRIVCIWYVLYCIVYVLLCICSYWHVFSTYNLRLALN